MSRRSDWKPRGYLSLTRDQQKILIKIGDQVAILPKADLDQVLNKQIPYAKLLIRKKENY